MASDSSRSSPLDSVEGTGRVTEIFAQAGKVLIDGRDPKEEGSYYEFDLHDLTYGGQNLKRTNDLTSIFFPQAHVQFTAQLRTIDDNVGGFLQDSSSNKVMRIVDMVRSEYPDPWAPVPPDVHGIQECYGVVNELRDATAAIKSEKWGQMRFDIRAVCLGDPEDRLLALSDMELLHRTVRFRCAHFANDSSWKVVAVMPLGDILSGEGIVMAVMARSAIIVSPAFGRIFMPYGALRLKRDHMRCKDSIFPDIRGLKVRFRITTNLPDQQSRWLAITVWPR